MQCTSPVSIEGGRSVPCGRCMSCRIAHAREWTIRILDEMSYHEASSFVTLTYRPEALPITGDLSKAHLQKFFKRLRGAIAPRRVKYYACGEYGSRGQRPHYHAIIFGLGPMDREVIEDSWDKGYIYLGTVTRYSAQYVAGYIMDKYAAKRLGDIEHKVRPWQTCSQGLGKKACEEHAIEYARDIGVRFNGAEVGLPRYYRKILDDQISDDDLNQRVLARAAEREELLRSRKVDALSEADYARQQRAQNKLTLDQRLAMHKRGRL